jgi:hypothetical protein
MPADSVKSGGRGSDAELQNKMLKEIEYLKGNPNVLNRPGTSSSEVNNLRGERDMLLEENKKLKSIVRKVILLSDE